MQESKSCALPLGYEAIDGGERRIRTAEPKGTDLQSACIKITSLEQNKNSDKNLRMSLLMVAPAGIEPATRGFSVLCSTD